jgi:hypothetical protein
MTRYSKRLQLEESFSAEAQGRPARCQNPHPWACRQEFAEERCRVEDMFKVVDDKKGLSRRERDPEAFRQGKVR